MNKKKKERETEREKGGQCLSVPHSSCHRHEKLGLQVACSALERGWGFTFGPGGAAEGKIQGDPINMQPPILAGGQELPQAAVRPAEAGQGKGAGGSTPDQATLIVRAERCLRKKSGP